MPVLQGNCNLRKPGSVSLPFLFFVGFFFFWSRNTYSAGECGMQLVKCRDSEAKLPCFKSQLCGSGKFLNLSMRLLTHLYMGE